MLALAGAPLDVRFRFLDPSPDACAGDVGELLVGSYDDPDLLDRLADGADAVTYEFENVPVEAARRVGAVPDARALELGQDRLVEKELFRSLGIPTARYGSLEDSGLPALVKSRRLGYDGKGQRVVESLVAARGRRARGGGRSVRSRAVDRRGARARRPDGLLPARRERAPRRDPGSLARSGARRAAARGRGDRDEAPRRARLRRRAGGRAVRGRGEAARERVRAACPQHRPLDDRRRGDEPVREPRARRSRAPARLDGGAR